MLMVIYVLKNHISKTSWLFTTRYKAEDMRHWLCEWRNFDWEDVSIVETEVDREYRT